MGTAAPSCPSSAARQLAGGVSNAREPTVAIPAKYACRTARSAITCLVLTMDPGPQSAAFKPRPVRNLLLLGALFIVGFVCSRSLRFNYSLFNYIFGWAVLCIPFFALRPILQLGKLSGFIGLILASPILLISLLLILTSVACDRPRRSCHDRLVEEAESRIVSRGLNFGWPHIVKTTSCAIFRLKHDAPNWVIEP